MRRPAALLTVLLGLATLGWNPQFPPELFRWNTGTAVVWNPDGGPLGLLSNSSAVDLTGMVFDKWENVPTANIDFVQGVQIRDAGGVPVDVTSANFITIVNLQNGQNPIIFDNDRDIFDAVGISATVGGIGTPQFVNGQTITKALLIIQGDYFDGEPEGTPPSDPGELDLPTLRGVMVHEVGHFVGLGHVTLNKGIAGINGCPAPELEQFVVMNPTGPGVPTDLHFDDEVGLSELYPAPGFSSSPRISGRLLDGSGNPFDGGNVILRPVTTDCDAIYDGGQAAQSGAYTSVVGPGGFRFAGLDRGADYTIEVKSIVANGSFPIGSQDPPPLGAPDEFYNGADEDWFQPPDDPAEATPVVPDGAAIEVRLNRSDTPGVVPATGPNSLRVDRFDGVRGLPPHPLLLDDGSSTGAWGFGGTNLQAWVNRFTPAAQDLPYRVERIDLMFWHGSAPPGRAIRLLVYVDPSGSGNPGAATLVHSQQATIQSPLSDQVYQRFPLTTPILVPSGDVYLGVIDQVADTATNFIGAYDHDTAAGRAFLQVNSTTPSGFVRCEPSNSNCSTDRTWMVRAFGSTVPEFGRIALTWGAPCNSATVPGQDSGVYRADLGVQAHDPIACTTEGRSHYLVAEDPADRSWLVSPQLLTREGSLAPHEVTETCQAVGPTDCP